MEDVCGCLNLSTNHVANAKIAVSGLNRSSLGAAAAVPGEAATVTADLAMPAAREAVATVAPAGKAPTAPSPTELLGRVIDAVTKAAIGNADIELLHRDADEEDFAAPVVSVSLGDTAVFRFGGPERGGKTETLKLSSGDVVVMGGPSRLCYHGIDRVLSGTSTLLKDGGRINLTLRRVTKP